MYSLKEKKKKNFVTCFISLFTIDRHRIMTPTVFARYLLLYFLINPADVKLDGVSFAAFETSSLRPFLTSNNQASQPQLIYVIHGIKDTREILIFFIITNFM